MHLQESICIWVRDPKLQKEDWHSYLDYEICIHTNSMCFTVKTSRVRRRFREFVWLRQKLQSNAVLIDLPELPPKIPFFNVNNRQTVEQRMHGLLKFLNKVVQCPLLLSDSRLHLFLQTQLSCDKIEACASGLTKYTVTEAIQKYAKSNRRFPAEEEEQTSCNVAPESSSVLGQPNDGCSPEDGNPCKENGDTRTNGLAPSPSE